jgi:hypothetical protein
MKYAIRKSQSTDKTARAITYYYHFFPMEGQFFQFLPRFAGDPSVILNM